MKTLFVLIQHLLPQHLLSRLTGKLADSRTPWLKNLLIEQFIKAFDVDMSQAQEEDPRAYACFNDFFTRPLKDGLRPIAPQGQLACPADGAISQLGRIERGRIFQAKGQTYSLTELLGGNEQQAADFDNGHFATIYLSPRDYHRLHMPLTGTLRNMTYVPGKLFSVNTTTAENVNSLFARNERLACIFDTEAGPMAIVLVGAMIVAAIETVWAGQVAPPPRTITTTDYPQQSENITLSKGDEMGRFRLGSTVILLFGENQVEWLEQFEAGTPTVMGEALARHK